MKTLKDNLIVFLATAGLIGYAPIAPGTAGSLAALPLCLLLACLRLEAAIVVLLLLIAGSVWISHAAEKLDEQDDPQHVVIDEVSGMAVALFGLPFIPTIVFAGFAFFRMFDVLKPFPIGWVDKRVSGGWGIVLDDLIAGLCANVLLRAGLHLI